MYQYIYEYGLPSTTGFQLNPPIGALSMQRWFRYFSKASYLKSQTGSFSSPENVIYCFPQPEHFTGLVFPWGFPFVTRKRFCCCASRLQHFMASAKVSKIPLRMVNCVTDSRVTCTCTWALAVQTLAVFSGENIPNKTWKLINNCYVVNVLISKKYPSQWLKSALILIK